MSVRPRPAGVLRLGGRWAAAAGSGDCGAGVAAHPSTQDAHDVGSVSPAGRRGASRAEMAV